MLTFLFCHITCAVPNNLSSRKYILVWDILSWCNSYGPRLLATPWRAELMKSFFLSFVSFVSNLFQLSYLSCHLWYPLQARDGNAIPSLELSVCWSASQDALADSIESRCQMECIRAEICLSFTQQDSSLCPTLPSKCWFSQYLEVHNYLHYFSFICSWIQTVGFKYCEG